MVAHTAAVTSRRESGDIFIMFEGWAHEEFVVANILADRFLEITKGDSADMGGNTGWGPVGIGNNRIRCKDRGRIRGVRDGGSRWRWWNWRERDRFNLRAWAVRRIRLCDMSQPLGVIPRTSKA